MFVVRGIGAATFSPQGKPDEAERRRGRVIEGASAKLNRLPDNADFFARI